MQNDALQVLKRTSRTFFIPISRLPEGLQEAVAAGYLCMRAIDEIEDHPELDEGVKGKLLRTISLLLQTQTSVGNFAKEHFDKVFKTYKGVLPEVTMRLADWACYAPKFIAPRIWEATAAMADRMAYWVNEGFKVVTQADLDRYTYGVAGAVGLMLCDIWAWFEKVQINRSRAIHFGRGLQLVNILSNRSQDMSRGVDFFPEGWTEQHMHEYAFSNLTEFDDYARTLDRNSFTSFVAVPRALAFATLDAIARGDGKLTRREVVAIVQQLEAR